MKKRDHRPDDAAWMAFLITAIILGLFVGGMLGGISRISAGNAAALGGVSAALLTAAAALFTGGFLGFLFGIPMFGEKNKDGDGAGPDSGVTHNTNLEQISDWLTKILIGVTLTQFRGIYDAINGFAENIGPTFLSAIGEGDQITSLAFAYLLFFAICGFLFGYLWSRVQLIGLFSRLGAGLQEIRSEMEDPGLIEEVQDFLSGASELADEKKSELKQRIKAANVTTRTKIFHRARRHRVGKRHKYETGDLSERSAPNIIFESKAMERVIPIFEALISADPDNYHRTYAQLGFVLKDQAAPRHAQAVAHFRNALRLRPPELKSDHLTYEMALAECLIMANPDSDAEAPVTKEITDLIEQAKAEQSVVGWPIVRDWLASRG